MRKTNVERRKHAWFALVDAESCRLLRCSLSKPGTQHVDEYDSLDSKVPQPEHGRPITQGGTANNDEEEERRFAGDIVEWLQKKAQEHEIERLAILAPPGMLGVLRTTPLGSLQGRLEELQGNLMRLKAGELAEHPMVRDLVLATDEP